MPSQIFNEAGVNHFEIGPFYVLIESEGK